MSTEKSGKCFGEQLESNQRSNDIKVPSAGSELSLTRRGDLREYLEKDLRDEKTEYIGQHRLIKNRESQDTSQIQ